MSETKICPCCHQPYIVKSPEENKREQQAMELYYQLGDGYIWNLQSNRVGFYSSASARTFKAAYPEFEVVTKNGVKGSQRITFSGPASIHWNCPNCGNDNIAQGVGLHQCNKCNETINVTSIEPDFSLMKP
jgi:hypothetical protein